MFTVSVTDKETFECYYLRERHATLTGKDCHDEDSTLALDRPLLVAGCA